VTAQGLKDVGIWNESAKVRIPRRTADFDPSMIFLGSKLPLMFDDQKVFGTNRSEIQGCLKIPKMILVRHISPHLREISAW